MVNWTYTSTGF